MIFFVADYMAGATQKVQKALSPDELTHDSQKCGTVTTCLVVSKLVGQSVVRGQDGQDVEERIRWTDVLLKENGRWHWIADHGGPIAVTQP